MAVHDYPETLLPQTLEWASIKAVAQHRSPFSGAVEAIEYPGERWRLSLQLPTRGLRASAGRIGQAEAFFSRLAGGVEQVRVWHFLRPYPMGTLRGTPTLAAPIVRGALSLQINTSGTLLAGDLFKVGGQVFQCFSDCAPVASVLTVPLVQRVRRPAASGAAVEWSRPTLICHMPSPSIGFGYSPGVASPVAVELDEVPQ